MNQSMQQFMQSPKNFMVGQCTHCMLDDEIHGIPSDEGIGRGLNVHEGDRRHSHILCGHISLPVPQSFAPVLFCSSNKAKLPHDKTEIIRRTVMALMTSQDAQAELFMPIAFNEEDGPTAPAYEEVTSFWRNRRLAFVGAPHKTEDWILEAMPAAEITWEADDLKSLEKLQTGEYIKYDGEKSDLALASNLDFLSERYKMPRAIHSAAQRLINGLGYVLSGTNLGAYSTLLLRLAAQPKAESGDLASMIRGVNVTFKWYPA